MKASGTLSTNQGRKPSRLQDFFIFCSGADRDIVYDCPTEWNKFAGIGATIFLTACLAMLSGAYAMHFVFDHVIFSLLFGIFWAIVIFNLDRYIVLSLRKEKIPTTTDILREKDEERKEQLMTERKRLLRNQLYMASPRFIIALIIAVTVSKPIEIRLFNDRIQKELESKVKAADLQFDEEEAARNDELNQQLATINQQELNDKTALFDKDPVYQAAKIRIEALQTDIRSNDAQIAANNKIIDANRYKERRTRTTVDPITKATTYTQFDVWMPNATAIAKMNENKALASQRQKWLNELAEQKDKQNSAEKSLSEQAAVIAGKYRAARNNTTLQIENLNKTYLQRKSDWINANKKSADLPARLEALGGIAHFSILPNSDHFLGNSIWWASLVITLLFMALETAPVVVKLLTGRGPYDEKLDAIEYGIYIEESQKTDTINRQINEYLKLADEAAKLSGSLKLTAEKERLETELANNKWLLDKIAGYQKELADIYTDAWFQEEKAKALQQVKGYHQLKQGNTQPPTFENIFWKQTGALPAAEYVFRHVSGNEGVVLHIENGQVVQGRWAFASADHKRLSIDLHGQLAEYHIVELNDLSFKLNDAAGNEWLSLSKA